MNLTPSFSTCSLQPGKILHAQKRQALVSRVGSRILLERAPLQMTDQLQDAAEAERDAILEDPHWLRPEDLGVPAGGLRQVTARHGDVGDIAPRRDRGVVQQAFGGPEACALRDRYSHRRITPA